MKASGFFKVDKAMNESMAILHCIKSEASPMIWLSWLSMMPKIDWSARVDDGRRSLAACLVDAIGANIAKAPAKDGYSLNIEWMRVWKTIRAAGESWTVANRVDVIKGLVSSADYLSKDSVLEMAPEEDWELLSEIEILGCIETLQISGSVNEVFRKIMQHSKMAEMIEQYGSEWISRARSNEVKVLLLEYGATPTVENIYSQFNEMNIQHHQEGLEKSIAVLQKMESAFLKTVPDVDKKECRMQWFADRLKIVKSKVLMEELCKDVELGINNDFMAGLSMLQYVALKNAKYLKDFMGVDGLSDIEKLMCEVNEFDMCAWQYALMSASTKLRDVEVMNSLSGAGADKWLTSKGWRDMTDEVVRLSRRDMFTDGETVMDLFFDRSARSLSSILELMGIPGTSDGSLWEIMRDFRRSMTIDLQKDLFAVVNCMPLMSEVVANGWCPFSLRDEINNSMEKEERLAFFSREALRLIGECYETENVDLLDEIRNCFSQCPESWSVIKDVLENCNDRWKHRFGISEEVVAMVECIGDGILLRQEIGVDIEMTNIAQKNVL